MILRILKPIACVLLASVVMAFAAHAQTADPPGRVARLNLSEGAVSVEPAGSDAWTEDVRNRPLTSGDRLWADRNARAEIHIGSSAVRVGSETGISVIDIDDRTIRLKLSAGSLQLRVRSLGPEQTFEVATPSASVAVLTPGSFRLDVDDSGGELRVAARDGEVAVTDASGATTVRAGQAMRFQGRVADGQRGSLSGADALDRWADNRDREEDRSESARYVSRDVTGYEDLDAYGRWQEAPDYGPIWIPTVTAGWTPYRDGHWVWVAPWGWTWIDDAPWGFAPFHYGRWVRFAGTWAWAPGPRQGIPYYAPALVAWVGSDGVGFGVAPVAWFPLGWNEVYIPTYASSRVYIQNINITNIHVHPRDIDDFVERGRRDGHPRRPDEYRNFGVGNAVVGTTREAFTSGQPVRSHPTDLGDLRRGGARVDMAGPSLRPSAASYGRPASAPPRAEIFARPAVSTHDTGQVPNREAIRTVSPSPNAPFRPAPEARSPAGASARDTALPARPDYRPAPAAPEPARAVPDYRPQPRPEPRVETPRPAPDYRPQPAPTPRYEAPRPTPEYRPQPAPEPRYEAPRPAPEYRPQPAPEPRYEAPRPAPEYRPQPAPEPHYEAPRPTPEYRPAAAPEYHAPPPPPPANKSAPAAQKDDRRDRPKDR